MSFRGAWSSSPESIEPHALRKNGFWVRGLRPRPGMTNQIRAFSSEVDTGSRSEKTRQNKKLEPRSDSIGTEKAPTVAIIVDAPRCCRTLRRHRALAGGLVSEGGG